MGKPTKVAASGSGDGEVWAWAGIKPSHAYQTVDFGCGCKVAIKNGEKVEDALTRVESVVDSHYDKHAQKHIERLMHSVIDCIESEAAQKMAAAVDKAKRNTGR